VIVYSLLVYFI